MSEMCNLLRARLRQVAERATTKVGARRLVKAELRELKKNSVLALDEKQEAKLIDEVVKQRWFVGG